MNMDLLRDVRNVIVANPIGFDMGHWALNRFDHMNHPCGTTCCIAGHALFLSIGEQPNMNEINIRERASRFLGINWHQSECLFYDAQWPYSFLSKDGQPPPLEASIELLDRLIDGRITLSKEGIWLGDLDYSPPSETPTATQEEPTEAVAHEEVLV